MGQQQWRESKVEGSCCCCPIGQAGSLPPSPLKMLWIGCEDTIAAVGTAVEGFQGWRESTGLMLVASYGGCGAYEEGTIVTARAEVVERI